MEVPGRSEESPCPEIQSENLFWRHRWHRKWRKTGWAGNLQLGIQLFELWLSPELLRTGASGPEKSKWHQEKRLSDADEIYCFYTIKYTGATQEGRKEGSEVGDSRSEARTGSVFLAAWPTL